MQGTSPGWTLRSSLPVVAGAEQGLGLGVGLADGAWGSGASGSGPAGTAAEMASCPQIRAGERMAAASAN